MFGLGLIIANQIFTMSPTAQNTIFSNNNSLNVNKSALCRKSRPEAFCKKVFLEISQNA